MGGFGKLNFLQERTARLNHAADMSSNLSQPIYLDNSKYRAVLVTGKVNFVAARDDLGSSDGTPTAARLHSGK